MDQQKKLMMINEMIEDIQSLSKYYIRQAEICRELIMKLVTFGNQPQLNDIDMSEKEFRELLYQILDDQGD